MAGLSGFSYYKEITISHANVDADLTNGIAYVPIVNDIDIGGECLGTGYDVQFANSDNSESLTFERLPGFTVGGGGSPPADGDFYVLIPTVAGASDTIIRCYYGKAGASNASSPENTFLAANGWSAVWHLEEAANPYLDATGNDNDSTAGTYPEQVAGKVAKGQDFDGTNSEYISVPDDTTLDFNFTTDDLTISAWINLETLQARAIATKVGAAYNYWSIVITFDDPQCGVKIEIGDGGGGHFVSCTDYDHNLSTGTWYHIAGRVDQDNSEGMRVFTNGVPYSGYNDPTAVGDASNDQPVIIGANFALTEFYNGKIDEIRVFKGLLSDAWIKFEYYNSHDGHAAGNELSWGAETAVGGPSAISISVGEE